MLKLEQVPSTPPTRRGTQPICIDAGRLFMKATPSLEGGHRVVYFEASKETRDFQGERVLTRALADSIPYFLKHGRIDLDHGSVTGEVRGQRINPYAMVIGRPVDARVVGDAVWVKAEILSLKDPSSDAVAMADYFWDTLRATPPIQWYASVHGLVMAEDGVVDTGGQATQEIRKLLWQSVALTQTPVNPGVGPVSTVPLRAFAKAFHEGRLEDLLAPGPVPAQILGASGAEAPAVLPPGFTPGMPADLGDPSAIDVEGILWVLASGLVDPESPFSLTDGRFPRAHVQAVLTVLAILQEVPHGTPQ